MDATRSSAADAAARHRQHAAVLTERVRGVGPGGWDAPAPVEGWAARDVVRHLVEWLPGFLAQGAGVELTRGPSVDEDPVAAWTVHAEAVQGLLEDPTTPGRTFADPHVGELPLDQAVDRFYTPDVFMHTWDLARATGQDDRLDPAYSAELLAGMEPMDAMLRASGQYGARVDVAADAPVHERLMGFIGRDPSWERPGP